MNIETSKIETSQAPQQETPLIDSFGREHTDLRLSLTDKCNFRCGYCMKEDQKFGPMNLEMTTPELLRVAGLSRELGIEAVRLTGGEPLVRKDAVEIVQELSSFGFADLSMTTNGSLLTKEKNGTTKAQALKNAGLDRINLSCDSLNPEKFAKIRRWGNLATVMAGLDEARNVGFEPMKMNTVIIKGQNDDEILDFVEFARESNEQSSPVLVRFIEFMPLGENGEDQINWHKDLVVGSTEILEKIKDKYPLEASKSQDDHAPASRWAFVDGKGEIGVIPTMTNPFCGNCNRLRFTADGFVMRCLFSQKQGKFSLRNAMRTGANDQDLKDIILQAVHSKKRGQDREIPDIYINPGAYKNRSRDSDSPIMSQIGG